jgi:hypothetical protein
MAAHPNVTLRVQGGRLRVGPVAFRLALELAQEGDPVGLEVASASSSAGFLVQAFFGRRPQSALLPATDAAEAISSELSFQVGLLQAQLAHLLGGAEFEEAVRQTRASTSNNVRFERHHDSK